MGFLVLDTETTGLVADRLPPDHPDQPHIVQLGALLLDDDGRERAAVSLIVNPGVPIPPAASAVHGITDEIARRHGVPPRTAVTLLLMLAEVAHTRVAHNLRFDDAVVEAAILRQKMHGMPEGQATFCTMVAATPVLDLPPTERMLARGMNRPKSPSLTECVRHFFGEDLDGAHDAMVDVRGCARVFRHLRSIGAGPAKSNAELRADEIAAAFEACGSAADVMALIDRARPSLDALRLLRDDRHFRRADTARVAAHGRWCGSAEHAA